MNLRRIYFWKPSLGTGKPGMPQINVSIPLGLTNEFEEAIKNQTLFEVSDIHQWPVNYGETECSFGYIGKETTLFKDFVLGFAKAYNMSCDHQDSPVILAIEAPNSSWIFVQRRIA